MKRLISKIIAQIRISSEGCLEKTDINQAPVTYNQKDIDLFANDSWSSLCATKFDLNYLNEIVYKVLNALKETSMFNEYMRVYHNQLAIYLRESLIKYVDNQRLVDCIEDIMIDISNILYNELTFYSSISSKGFIRLLFL